LGHNKKRREVEQSILKAGETIVISGRLRGVSKGA